MLVFQIALRMLAREWRSGELGVLLLAVTVAVTALTGVGFLVERIGVAIDLQASEVLAADLRLGSPQPLSQKYIDEAQRRELGTARSTNLLSVVFFGEQSQLSNVRAVSDGYPLRGTVRIADIPFSKGAVAARVPARGEVWPDSR
jgi:putative ABC transport system permease protein